VIRAVGYLLTEAIWSLVFKVAERFPIEPRPDGWYTTPDEPWDGSVLFEKDAHERARILGGLIDKRPDRW
jgi:hypothetical protein